MGEKERMDKNMEYTPAWSNSHSLNICFHFGVLLSTLCQKIWSPQMWRRLFSSGSLAHPTYFFSLILILVGKLSLVINHAFSPEQRCTSAKNYVFLAVNPSSLVFHLRVDISFSLESFSGSSSTMRVENSLQRIVAFFPTCI